MEKIAAEGRGVLPYSSGGPRYRPCEQDSGMSVDEGFDTVEANERLGFKADQRLRRRVQILRDPSRSMWLLSNNPRKLVGIAGYGSVSEWSCRPRFRRPTRAPVSQDQEGKLDTSCPASNEVSLTTSRVN
jgi:GTP cyclohydrolase II